MSRHTIATICLNIFQPEYNMKMRSEFCLVMSLVSDFQRNFLPFLTSFFFLQNRPILVSFDFCDRFLGKLVVTNGYARGSNNEFTEVFDLLNNATTCQNLRFPKDLASGGASMGFVKDKLLICGGSHFTTRCIDIYGTESSAIRLNIPRAFAASVSLGDKFMMLGGYGEKRG